MAALAAAAVVIGAVPALANPESRALARRAADALYNMDREEAIAIYRRAIDADPYDPAAYRGLAAAWWLTISVHRCTMTVDNYLGRITRSHTPP